MARPKRSSGAVERLDKATMLQWFGYIDMWGCPIEVARRDNKTTTVKSTEERERPTGLCRRCGCYIRWDEEYKEIHRKRCQ